MDQIVCYVEPYTALLDPGRYCFLEKLNRLIFQWLTQKMKEQRFRDEYLLFETIFQYSNIDPIR